MVDQNIASYPLSSPPPPALQSTSVHQSIKLFLLNVLIVGFIAFMFAFVLNYFNLIVVINVLLLLKYVRWQQEQQEQQNLFKID